MNAAAAPAVVFTNWRREISGPWSLIYLLSSLVQVRLKPDATKAHVAVPVPVYS